MSDSFSRRSFLKAAAAGGAAVIAGEADAEHWDNPVCGRVTANGKPMDGVVVTDGRVCIETAKDGRFRIPGRKGVRFISITVPSGWRISRHYIPFSSPSRPYLFDLKPWPASKPGAFTFMHIGDSEIDYDIEKEKPWVARAKAFADERNCAFFVHTGDICASLDDAHLRLMNEDTVGRPVFYVLGNHDVIAAEYGEKTFERVFGPCWYSFDAGGTHFVVTPMMWGDGVVSYKVDEIVDWLRNDLEIAKRRGQPVIHLVHGAYDNGVFDATKLFSESKVMTKGAAQFDFAAACDLKAIVHGHLHVNYFRRSKDRRLEVVSVAPPAKGVATLQVVHVDAQARLRAENRYGMGDWRENDETPRGGWLAKVAGIVYCGAPCVADGRVVVGTSDFEGRLPPGAHAFDAKTGSRLWSYATESDVTTRVLADRGRVYVQDENWRVSALDGRTGRELWKTDLRGAVGLIGARLSGGADSRLAGALTLDPTRNRLYVGAAEKSLLALDPDSGKIVWRTDSERTCFLCTPSCTVACGDTVVGGIYWDALFGYDAETGRRLWRHGRNNSPDTQTWYKSGVPWIERLGFPVYRNGRLYIASHEHFFEVVPRTGEMLRVKKFPFSVNCYHEPLFLGDRVYFGSQTRGLVCVDMKTFDLVWTSPTEPSLFCPMNSYLRPGTSLLATSPVFWKGLVWATCQDGALYAWDPQTGRRQERLYTGTPYTAAATVADGRLYTVDFTGRIRCYV